MAKKHSVIRVLLCLAILFALVFSVFYVAVEADHDCVGEDCAVCQQVARCESLLRIALPLFASALFALAGNMFSALCLYTSAETANKRTPVALKVKLSD